MNQVRLPKTKKHLLEIQNLSIDFKVKGGNIKAVRNISFFINRGETLALVGESGSGKSVTALSILKLLQSSTASYPSGSITIEGLEIFGSEQRDLQTIRGNKISMIFQEPMTSLNPLHNIGQQIKEILYTHQKMSSTPAQLRTLELLNLVGLKDAERRVGAYPHQLSGGERQRVMIAMALANNPDLLIADEPTTALDVTVQAQVLGLLKTMQSHLGMSILLITHDLSIVKNMANRICVMSEGIIVETGKTETIFTRPQHPYTKMLMNAEPRKRNTSEKNEKAEIISCNSLRVHFPIKSGIFRRTVGYIQAVHDITITVKEGHTLGIVGESGSGKTTLGLALLRLIRSEGIICFKGRVIQGLKHRSLRPLRREMQIVFQDPFASLSPRLSAGQIIEEGLLVHGLGETYNDRCEIIATALKEVGLDPNSQDRYPHEFSGGQRQRIAIARAIVLKPKLIILDEPTSSLDRSVQAQIINLLQDLQARYGLAYIFISHDLKTVRAMADEIAVMRQGELIEQGTTEKIFDFPQTVYTRSLISAAFD